MGTNDNTGWQPIETAPRDENVYIVAYDPLWCRPSISIWDDDAKIFRDEYNDYRQPTLWVPLPALPKEDTQVTAEEKQALLEDMTARDDVGICSEHRDPPANMLWQDKNGRWHEFHGARKPTLAEVEASADVVLIDRESGRPKQVRPVAIRWPNGDEWSK